MHRQTITRTVVVLVASSSMLGASTVYAAVATSPATVTGGSQGGGGNGGSWNSRASITATFYDNCTDFHVESSKDILFVSVNYEDDNYT